MADKTKMAQAILADIGGQGNVTNAWHCITRLRFNLADKDKVDLDAIKKISGVMGAQFSGDQFQVIIGSAVGDVFDAVNTELGGQTTTAADTATTGSKEGPVSRLMDVISGIFTPILPALAGTGLIKGFLPLFVMLGWMSAEGAWYRTLYMVADAVFYFLPFFIAVTAAKKFKTSEFLSLTLAGVLLYPTMINAATQLVKAPAIKLWGVVDVPFVSYSSSVIPIILGVWLLSHVHRWVRSWMPEIISMMFTPMVTLLIVTPILLVVLGPLGNYAGAGVSAGLAWLFTHAGIFAGLVLGATMPLLVMTGMHYGLLPIVMTNFQTLGYDFMLMPVSIVSNIAQSGAAFAVALRTKNSELRQLGISSGVSALLGVTEPAMYGVNLRKRRPFYAVLAAGGISAAVVIALGAKAYAMPGMPGLIALPVFISTHGIMNLVWMSLGVVLSFVLAFVFTLVLGFEDDPVAAPAQPANAMTAGQGSVTLLTPVAGEVEPLSAVSDPTFATGIMGKGLAVIPSEGKIVAPLSGQIAVLPESKHAIGITGDDGTELLIHIGIDTVEMGGKGFTAHVKVGDHVTAGTPLVDVDLAAVRAAGYDPTVMVIITNSGDFSDVVPTSQAGPIFTSEQLLMAIR